MHRTEGEDFKIESGKRRFASAVPPAQKATRLPAEFMNAVQEEIALVIENAGMTLNTGSSADRTSGWGQLWEAITTKGIIGTTALSSDAVTTAKILNLAVTSAKLGNLAVTEPKIASDAVTTTKILAGAVTETKIATSAVSLVKLNNSVLPRMSNKFHPAIVNSVQTIADLQTAIPALPSGATSWLCSVNLNAQLRFNKDHYSALVIVDQTNDSIYEALGESFKNSCFVTGQNGMTVDVGFIEQTSSCSLFFEVPAGVTSLGVRFRSDAPSTCYASNIDFSVKLEPKFIGI